MPRLKLISLVMLALAGLLSACLASPATPTAAPATVPATAIPATATAGNAATEAPGSTDAPAATSAATAGSGDQIVLQLAATGNEARYRVREQLANVSLPSDAIGRTSAVSGTIVINPDGSPVSAQSKIVVDITGLKSDRDQRDNFLRRSVLETSTYPTVEFVPTQVTGLPNPLPASGDVTFQLTGDLTVHGTTKSVTWDVTATVTNGSELSGTATTSFTFADFGLQQPRVPVVLSVEDTIKLELDFHFVKAN